jgi:hypothetical protein
MSYFPSIYGPRIIVEIEDMSCFPSIYGPRIIVEIEDISYFPSIYDPRIIVQIEDMSYFHQSMNLPLVNFTPIFVECYTKNGRRCRKIIAWGVS